METEALEKALQTIANKVKDTITADEALKYTQALLNLGHAITMFKNIN